MTADLRHHQRKMYIQKLFFKTISMSRQGENGTREREKCFPMSELVLKEQYRLHLWLGIIFTSPIYLLFNDRRLTLASQIKVIINGSLNYGRH